MIIALLVLIQDSDEIARDVSLANAREKVHLQFQVLRSLESRRPPDVAREVLRFVQEKGQAALSPGFTQWLGWLKDDAISKLLSELVADRKFAWRPQAMRALAQQGDKRRLETFQSGLSDHQWGCRVAAVVGLERLGDRDSIPRMKGLLADEIYDVRAQAAKTLYSFGDPSGLPVLVEALRDETTWFEIDYGQIAREDAWTFLKGLAQDDFGYKPWEPSRQRAEGLAKWDAWIGKTMPDWRERVPKSARARIEHEEFDFGYELRSCQKGDFFLRLDRKGNLVLGCFNLERAPLSPEEQKAFNAAIERVAAVDRRVIHGTPGCDCELFRLKVGKTFVGLNIGLRGRPETVQPWIRLVTNLLREKFGEGAAQEFREKTLLFQAEE